jgi:hypothetical protein
MVGPWGASEVPLGPGCRGRDVRASEGAKEIDFGAATTTRYPPSAKRDRDWPILLERSVDPLPAAHLGVRYSDSGHTCSGGQDLATLAGGCPHRATRAGRVVPPSHPGRTPPTCANACATADAVVVPPCCTACVMAPETPWACAVPWFCAWDSACATACAVAAGAAVGSRGRGEEGGGRRGFKPSRDGARQYE